MALRTGIAALSAALVCAVVVVIAHSGSDGGDAPPAAATAVHHVAPGRLLARAPYMGVSCRTPNSIACDRVGLAVWLRRPARAVTAIIGGRRFALDDLPWSGPERGGGRRELAGFLRHAGLRGSGPLAVDAEDGGEWFGRRPVVATVVLDVETPRGAHEWTRTRVALSPGWG